MRIAKRITRTFRSCLYIANFDTVFSGARLEAEAVIVAARTLSKCDP